MSALDLRQLAGRSLALADRVRPWRIFDRPVLIVAGPRTGSTLLFDLLQPHPDLVSWPFEALDAYARVTPPEHPIDLGMRWPAHYATPERRRELTRALHLGRRAARRSQGLTNRPLDRLALRKVRFLEKSPPSILRLEALARLFPDAKLVVLQRDAPGTIASLMEVWETPSLAHARGKVGGRDVHWTMLAPPGWLSMMDAPVAEKAAFQWAAAAECSLRDLGALPADRCLQLTYEELVADPAATLRRVLEFAELETDPAVLAAGAAKQTKGRSSISPPRAEKWRARAEEIEPLLPRLAGLRRALGYEVDDAVRTDACS
jgi:hypothetical protein